MASVSRLTLIPAAFAAAILIGSWATAAERGCSQCGCQRTTKMTRLVTTLEEIEIPDYQCTTTESYRPKKEIVRHTGYRCDEHYKLDAKWCCKEHCTCHAHSEHVTHYVDKNPCDSCSERHTEHHRHKHVDYQIDCTSQTRVSCRTERGCKTLYGASPKGCMAQVCTKQPTGEVRTHTVPVVRWVTFDICPDCDHSWPSDQTASR